MLNSAIEVDRIEVPRDIRVLIDAIGEDAFGSQLIKFLNEVCGARHCVVFGFGSDSPHEIAALSVDGTSYAHNLTCRYLKSEAWKRDPSIALARECASGALPGLIRLNIDALQDEELRNEIYPRLSERLLVFGQLGFGPGAISVLGPDYVRHFERDAISSLRAFTPSLLSVIG